MWIAFEDRPLGPYLEVSAFPLKARGKGGAGMSIVGQPENHQLRQKTKHLSGRSHHALSPVANFFCRFGGGRERTVHQGHAAKAVTTAAAVEQSFIVIRRGNQPPSPPPALLKFNLEVRLGLTQELLGEFLWPVLQGRSPEMLVMVPFGFRIHQSMKLPKLLCLAIWHHAHKIARHYSP